MRHVFSTTFIDAKILAPLGRTSLPSGEFLTVAAGGIAMLLVVGIFDMFGLLH